jgi:cytochrome c oxidase subunit 2
LKRRTLLLGALAAAMAGARGAEPEVIRIQAVKFEFHPDTINLKVGVPVVLELLATEVEMGFSAPGLKLQADLPPGKPVRLELTPAKAGDFEFVCDVFCGSGHEDMGGVIKVQA